MKYKFGNKIREIREKRQLTLKEVAKQAEVSESLISQIERNKVSPAIDTLLTIAQVLSIDFEFLFREVQQSKKIHVTTAKKRKTIKIDNIVYELLSKTIDSSGENEIEAYYINIPPNNEKGSSYTGHHGSELGVIIEGEADFVFGDDTYHLKKGDSISFQSDVPHFIRNKGEIPFKAFWVTTPPKQLL